MHPNTAFGLVFALDYARTEKDTAFEKAIVLAAQRIYGSDKNAPATQPVNIYIFQDLKHD